MPDLAGLQDCVHGLVEQRPSADWQLGVGTAPVVLEIAAEHSVPTPICSAINAVVSGEQSTREALRSISSHQAGHEMEPG